MRKDVDKKNIGAKLLGLVLSKKSGAVVRGMEGNGGEGRYKESSRRPLCNITSPPVKKMNPTASWGQKNNHKKQKKKNNPRKMRANDAQKTRNGCQKPVS